MFIGFLQDLSDIVLIYTLGPVYLEAVRMAELEPSSFKCSFGSALPIVAWGEDLSGQLDGGGPSQ